MKKHCYLTKYIHLFLKKKKIIKPYERSVLQLHSVLLKNQKGDIKTFKFLRDFVIMNQVSRQKAISKVKKDFYKLMNNSNYGNDCRNNIDSCNFEVVYDDTEEISYIQKYTSLYFDEYRDFACPETIKF